MSEPGTEYRAWLVKADEDRLCVRNEMNAVQKPWGVICFHCQQAAEKYLKAFLVQRGVKPERTHDLAQLVAACTQVDESLSALRPACIKLSDFAVDVRYPGVPVEVEEQMAKEAVEVAEQICNAIRKKLPA
jgi:HEPN domain-containing protein